MAAADRRAGQLAGRIGLLGLLVAGLAVVGSVLSGCGQSNDVEPVVGQVDATVTAAIATAPSLPTPAATLLPPASPTPAPTVAPALLSADDAIQATQTAAVHPPTPPVSVTPPVSGAPLPTPFGVYSWTLKVPILMYHYISQPPADADIYRVDLSVTPDNFRQQLAWLRDNGYTAIDYDDLSTAIVGMAELPEKPVLLTFDDGYLDNYTQAFPILQRHGLNATFYVTTNCIDNREILWTGLLRFCVFTTTVPVLETREPMAFRLPLRTPVERREAFTKLIVTMKNIPTEKLRSRNSFGFKNGRTAVKVCTSNI